MRYNIKLFASDLDGTLIATNEKTDSKALYIFKDLMKSAMIPITYITGRHFDLALQGIENTDLPIPDYLVCDVGTSLYKMVDGAWKQDIEYTKELLSPWQGKTADEICKSLEKEYGGITPQEPERQTPAKKSFYIEDLAESKQLLKQISTTLKNSGFSSEIITSKDPKSGRGLLDILPAGSGKRAPLLYLANINKIPLNQIAFAGDSGNDIQAMESGVRSIVVGNASRDLLEELQNKISLKTIQVENLFFASGNDVNGVVEGCHYFQIFN